jgi:hypothetical protein
MLCAGIASGYLVGPAVSLEKLTAEADIIFKGTAVSSGPAQDDWFTPYQGFVVRQTQFKVISVIKGQGLGGRLSFRHYDENPQPQGRFFQPQYYHFEIGRTYIVFAKQGGSAGVFRQLWMNHTCKEDQGVLRCANDKPVDRKTIKEGLWAELTAMLTSGEVPDVIYAIGQLDQMSGKQAGFDGTSDFSRMDVLAAVRGLMTDGDPKIAQAAIGVVGSHDPYMDDDRAIWWLATVGSAEIPGVAKMDPNTRNPGGALYWKDLVALADSRAPGETRAAAIRALGLVREPSLEKPIERWLADPVPSVRASAALLMADFPGPEADRRLTALADDAAPEVRACVARAVGFAQQVELADVLAKLLADKEREVRRAAAMSLLSFSPKHEAIAAIFQANIENREFKPLFLIALARENPAGYLDGLATAVEQKTEPEDFWGGQVPAFTAWEILFKFLQAQPAEEVRSGKFDRYLDAMEKVGNYSSSEPRDIYAFYLQRGMTGRASKFRQEANKAIPYDMEYYFKQVDENPSLYTRQ